MAQIRNFKDAHHTLQKAYDVGRPTTYTLERMRALLDFLGNPQNDLRVIHVAGTSGKTSTAYYAAALLKSAGFTVGLTVSPHVDEVNERLQIDLIPLPEAEFCEALGQFLELVDDSQVKPSYFELMIALAFYEFRRRAVDYAVVEVGLGGLLDATNAIDREDKICIITDIGLDHVDVLGYDLATIAAKKAGIIQPHNDVFMYGQTVEVVQKVQEIAAGQRAHLQVLQPSPVPEASVLPLFQRRNFGLALAATSFLLERDGHGALDSSQLSRAVGTYIPARMEIKKLEGAMLIIDGAHNAQKFAELLKSVGERFPDKPIAALVAFLSGHDSRWQDALDVLLPAAAHLIITSFSLEQVVPKTAEDPREIAAYCQARGFANYRVELDPARALQALLAGREPVKLVTGSFYLLNDIRPLTR